MRIFWVEMRIVRAAQASNCTKQREIPKSNEIFFQSFLPIAHNVFIIICVILYSRN